MSKMRLPKFGLLGFLIVNSGAWLGLPAIAQSQPTLTIYVDEGRGEVYGHVFVALSDGKQTQYAGFYPLDGKLKAVTGMARGVVINDKSHQWSVRSQSYPLSPAGYQKAHGELDTWIAKFNRGELKYSLFTNSCGDFAQAVAKSGGAALDLPWALTKSSRPGNFGDYLRKHGGITNPDSEKPKPAAASNEAALAEANGHVQTGRSLFRQRQKGPANAEFAQAEAIYQKLAQSNPDNAQYHSLLAGAQAAQQKWGAAEINYQEASRLEPSNSSYREMLNLVRQAQKHK